MSVPEIAFDVVTFGETMLRLAAPDALRLGQSSHLDITFGGAESNVAVNLARLGKRTAWLSRLPDHPLAHQLLTGLRGDGVSTDSVMLVEGERLGTYYVEVGSAPRPTRVWYDRTHSAASRLSPDDVPSNWIERSRWLHLTGITPALSESCAAAVWHAVERAKTMHIPVSFDVNYRALLWDTARAAHILEPLCRAADLVLIARRDAEALFGVAGEAETIAAALYARWGIPTVVTNGAQGATACVGDHFHSVTGYPSILVDRFGAGDAFASGIIDQRLDGASWDQTLHFAAALAALKLSIVGDVARVSRKEVEQVLQLGDATLVR